MLEFNAMTQCRLVQVVFGFFGALTFIFPVASSIAGGNCLLHPAPFRLQSDNVHWSVKIDSGAECIQGLRWSTIMIEDISIVDQPKLGRVLIQGPSFRYFSNPGAQGSDSFKLSISGTSLRLKGTSLIEVDVTVH
jgi:hypothetical protein